MVLAIPGRGIALESPLRRPAVARRTAIVLGALLLIAAAVLSLVVGAVGGAAAWVFLRALIVSSALSAVPIAILWFLDRRERETPSLYAAAFFWGGLIATTFALPLNTVLITAIAGWLEQNADLRNMLGPDAALMIGAPLAAPLVEETIKGIGIVLLFWLVRGEFDNTRDGFIYGALIGAGFNWFESALYVQQSFVQFGAAPFGFQLGARYAWLGLAGHAMFSGIFGAALGYARVTSKRWWGAIVALAGFSVAVVAHAWNNSLPLLYAIGRARGGVAAPIEVEAPPDVDLLEAMIQTSISNLIVFLPFVIMTGWILWWSGERERRVIREELADEVGGVISTEEYAAVVADRRFHTRRIDSLDPKASRLLIEAQHELAFRKRRLKLRGDDVDSDPVVLGRRVQIERMRGRLDDLRGRQGQI